MGDESPEPIAVFHRTFWPGPKWTGGLPPPSPEEFGPLNWGHHASPPFSAARGELERTSITRRIIHGARFILNSQFLISAPASVFGLREHQRQICDDGSSYS